MFIEIFFSRLRLRKQPGLIKTIIFLILPLKLCCLGNIEAAPTRYYNDQTAVVLREMRDNLDDLRHEVSNHEIEIKTYDEKVRTLETIIDSMRQQWIEAGHAQTEAWKDSSKALEMKINSLELLTQGIISDVKQFKTYTNEIATTLSQYKQKLTEFEKIIEFQNQNIDNLHQAIKSVAEALNPTSGLSEKAELPSVRIYKVVPGDTLEKIARKHQTTIQAIKELNGLSHDKIVVGQNLRIP